MAGKKPAKVGSRSVGAAKEKGPKGPRYLVVAADDVLTLKYPRTADSDGFALEHALSLAAPVAQDLPRYAVISVEEYEAALAADVTPSLREIVVGRDRSAEQAAA